MNIYTMICSMFLNFPPNVLNLKYQDSPIISLVYLSFNLSIPKYYHLRMFTFKSKILHCFLHVSLLFSLIRYYYCYLMQIKNFQINYLFFHILLRIQVQPYTHHLTNFLKGILHSNIKPNSLTIKSLVIAIELINHIYTFFTDGLLLLFFRF